MRIWSLPILALGLLALSCNSPTDNEEEKDPRLKLFKLYSLPGGLVDLGSHSPHQWEGQDGARFQIFGGQLRCLTPPAASLDFYWHVLEPDSIWIRASGRVIFFTEQVLTCEWLGDNSISFHFPNTGEVLQGDVRTVGGCVYLDISLPSEEALRGGVVEGEEIPPYVVLPDPMPVATYRELFCDVIW